MNQEHPIRVLIADDHAVVRGGLEFFLSSLEEVKLVGQANHGQQAIQLCAQLQPDVVLMDLEMPRMNGVEATRIIRQQHPHIQVVVLTSFNQPDLIQDVFAAGAISYLLKNCSADALKEAIFTAYQGQSTISPEVSQLLVQELSATKGKDLAANLTRREREVLEGLVQGLNNVQIATNLNISRNTVRFHIRNILGKLNASNRTEAAAIALKRGLVRHQ